MRALGGWQKISCRKSTHENSVFGFMFFALLTSRETLMQNYLTRHLYREWSQLQIRHCLSYCRDQAFGAKPKAGLHIKLQAVCCSLSCFQHPWVSRGLDASGQSSVSKGNVSRDKKQGECSEHLWTGKLKIWKELCTLSLWRAVCTFSSTAKAASAVDKVSIHLTVWGELIGCFPKGAGVSGSCAGVSQGCFMGWEARKLCSVWC